MLVFLKTLSMLLIRPEVLGLTAIFGLTGVWSWHGGHTIPAPVCEYSPYHDVIAQNRTAEQNAAQAAFLTDKTNQYGDWRSR